MGGRKNIMIIIPNREKLYKDLVAVNDGTALSINCPSCNLLLTIRSISDDKCNEFKCDNCKLYLSNCFITKCFEVNNEKYFLCWDIYLIDSIYVYKEPKQIGSNTRWLLQLDFFISFNINQNDFEKILLLK